MMLSRDIENIETYPNETSRDEIYNSWDEKYTAWNVQQIKHYIKID